MSNDSLILPVLSENAREEDARQALQEFAKNYTTIEKPFRGVDNEKKLSSWRLAFSSYPALVETFGGLRFLRCVALAVRNTKPKETDGQDAAYYLASRWVRFLISDQASQEKFFLQEYVSRDSALYETNRLRPKSPPEAWSDLPTVKSRQLTITEWELTLAIFVKDEGEKVRFTWWLSRYPHLLWRIHAFLLRRYCFPLLKLFSQAQKNTPREIAEGSGGERASSCRLDRPPFRAGEFWRLYPRIGALTLLGLLAVVGLTPALAFFFAAHPALVAAGVVSCLGLQVILAYIDVFKQNRGVMTSGDHARPRVWGLTLRMFAWGLALSAVFLGLSWVVQLLPNEWHGLRPDLARENLLLPAFRPLSSERIARLLLGWLGLAASSGAIGALLQWIWEERAATEPI